MTWFKNLRVKTKLLTNFSVVIIFAIALTAIAVLTVNRIDTSYSYLLEYPQIQLEHLLQLNTRFSDMRRTTTAIMLNASDSEVANNYWNQFDQAYNEAVSLIDKYISNNSSDTVMDKTTLDANNTIMQNVKKQLEGYREQARLGTDSALAGDDFATTNAMFLGGASMITEAVNAVAELIPKAVEYTSEISDANTEEKNWSIIMFAGMLGLIIVLSIILTMYVSSLISSPINILAGFMEKAGSTGDITLRPEDVENIGKLSIIKDEIGRCIGACANFVQHMIEISEKLQVISGGDLTAEIVRLSDADVMGQSLNSMTENLNGMFNEIQMSTTQIAAGSKQIADGAQSLAQGATEQASAVEELSSSINEIANKTKQNAGVAREAAELSGTIRDSAEKGSAQMEQMMQAVMEINEASNKINKVIKVIDDIAFQTNILALNASVEAARAGQHGKGFAVVAEEVRSLAAKSADAAKDTGKLIENSIEKANFGLSIATETSSSLKKIVEGIIQSAKIVSEIAQSSDQQASAIAQINVGIEQVAQVVQQNSATAQESAAASEEMNGQSEVLEQLVSHFKLKDTEGLRGIPARRNPLALPGRKEQGYEEFGDGQ